MTMVNKSKGGLFLTVLFAAAMGSSASYGQQDLAPFVPLTGGAVTGAVAGAAPSGAGRAAAPLGGGERGRAEEMDAAAKARAEQDKAAEMLFQELLREGNPLTPDQNRRIIKETEAQAKARMRPAPEFSKKMAIISLDPMAPTPIVEMDLGLPSAISFVDSTGQPWPYELCKWSTGFTDRDEGTVVDARTGQQVQAQGNGPAPNADAEGAARHVIMLRATDLAQHGNMICTLQGLATPVNLRLEAGNHKHYMTFIGRIDRMGPNRVAPIYTTQGAGLQAGNEVLSNFLLGLPPQGAEAMEIEGGAGKVQAWRYQRDKYHWDLYVRSGMLLLSPQATEMSTLGGIHIYRMAPMPLLSFDDDGQNVEILVKGAKVVRATIPADVAMGRELPTEAPLMAVRNSNGISGDPR